MRAAFMMMTVRSQDTTPHAPSSITAHPLESSGALQIGQAGGSARDQSKGSWDDGNHHTNRQYGDGNIDHKSADKQYDSSQRWGKQGRFESIADT